MKPMLLRTLALIALSSPRLVAQTATTDLPVGAPLPGGRHVAEVLQVALDDDGRRLAWVRGDLGEGKLLLRDDEVVALRAQPLNEPAGTALGEIGALRFDGDGNPAAGLALLRANHRHDSAIFWRNRLVAQEGTVPAFVGAPPGTVYAGFGVPHPFDGGLVVTVTLRDPAVLSAVQHFLVRFELDAQGDVIAAERLLGADDVPAGAAGAVIAVAADGLRTDANESGDWAVGVSLDGVGYAVVRNGAVVAANGAPSLEPGLAYQLVGHTGKLDLNDFGALALTTRLGSSPQASLDAILVDGHVFVRAEDVVDGLTVLDCADFPVALSNSGDLYWSAVTRDAQGELRSAHFRNRTAIVVEGVTSVEGRLVTHFHPDEDEQAFVVSASGRFFGGWGELEGLGRTLVRIDFGAAVPVPGCQPNPGALRLADGTVLAGRTITLELDGAPSAGMSAALVVGTPLASACGTVLSFGELLIDPAGLSAIPAGTFAGSALSVPIAIPADPALIDVELALQGVFLDPAHTLPGPDVVLTNALRFEIGAP